MHGAYNVKVISLLQSNSLKNVTAAVKIKIKIRNMPQQKDVLFTFRLPVKYLKAKYLSRNFNTTMWGRNTRRTRHNVSEETS